MLREPSRTARGSRPKPRSLWTRAFAVTLGAALLLGGTVASVSVARADDEAAVQDLLRQGKHYYRRGLLKEALQALKKALATAEGRENAKVQLLAAKIYRDRGEIDLSFRALSKARKFGTDKEEEQADRLYKGLKKSFGEIRILPAGGVHVKGRIFLDSMERFINVKRKSLFQAVRRALLVRARRYPDSIWIPYGEYKANGAAFKHEKGKRTEVVVPFPTVAILRSDSHDADKRAIIGFKRRVGGVSKVYNMEGKLEKGRAIAERLRREKPALLIALGAKAAVLAKRELRRYPMVFGMIEDDWRSYELRKKGDATGVSLHPAPGQVIERFHRAVPDARRVGVLHEPGRRTDRIDELRSLLREEDMSLVPIGVTKGEEVPGALSDVAAEIDAVWMLPDPPLTQLGVFRRLVKDCITLKKPLIVPSGELVRSGAFMAVEGDRRGMGVQMAAQARRILFGGLAAAELDVELPETLSWHINRAVAKKIGVRLPKDLLSEVDLVHETLPSGGGDQ